MAILLRRPRGQRRSKTNRRRTNHCPSLIHRALYSKQSVLWVNLPNVKAHRKAPVIERPTHTKPNESALVPYASNEMNRASQQDAQDSADQEMAKEMAERMRRAGGGQDTNGNGGGQDPDGNGDGTGGGGNGGDPGDEEDPSDGEPYGDSRRMVTFEDIRHSLAALQQDLLTSTGVLTEEQQKSFVDQIDATYRAIEQLQESRRNIT